MLAAQRSSENSLSLQKLISHLLMYFHHAYLQQALEMYYNKKTPIDLSVSLENGCPVRLVTGAGVGTVTQCSHLEKVATRGRVLRSDSWLCSSGHPAARSDAD